MSPILDIQRRLREVGRIRIGDTVEQEKRGGGTFRRPRKLDTFKFTSRDRQVIEAAAQLYGGEATPWPEQAGQFQVVTDVDVVPVIVPPSEMSFSQFYELWSGGGCQRRCDGHWDMLNEKDCQCDPEQRTCSIHTRLSVMLPDLPGLGVWRIDTQGYYAAVEIGGAVEVCQAVAARGQHLPARLRLEHREVKRIGRDNKPETRKFSVPVLDVDVAPGALTTIGTPAGAPVAIGNGGAAALPAAEPAGFTPVPAAAELGPGPSIADQVADSAARQPVPRRNAATPIPATGTAPSTAAEANNLTCSRCGRPYAEASVVKGNAGESKYVHGTCPDGDGNGGAPTSGPDGPGSASDGAHPTATADDPISSPGASMDGQAGEEAASAASSPARSRQESDGLTARDIGQEATKVWPTDSLPKGKATKERDRRKYTLAHALTNGPVHYDDLDRRQRYLLWRTLNDIVEGRITLAEDAAGLLLTQNGETVHAAWWTEPEAERGAA